MSNGSLWCFSWGVGRESLVSAGLSVAGVWAGEGNAVSSFLGDGSLRHLYSSAASFAILGLFFYIVNL